MEILKRSVKKINPNYKDVVRFGEADDCVTMEMN